MSRRRRTLRPEEAALWDRVAAGTRPLKPAREAAVFREEKAPPEEYKREPAPIPTFRIGESAPARLAGHVLLPAIGDRIAGQPVRMDRKAFGRMSRGKMRPEARLDLHGMTVVEAHPALTRFILRSQAEGRRLVLVVTGKGRDSDEGGPIPAPRGILRHQVPAWLSQPPLSGVVLQVAEAHRKHGGGGAYYVYLRRMAGSGAGA